MYNPLKQKGFTLIELLVVVSIVGLLSSVISVSLVQARGKARDASRKATLNQLQKALELYHINNGQYPCSNPEGDCGNPVWRSSEPDDCCETAPKEGQEYIPGLVPSYLSQLPRDPKGGISSHEACGKQGWYSAFLYISDGEDYKLLSNCSPESEISPSDSFYDAVRPTWAWQISTSGAAVKGW